MQQEQQQQQSNASNIPFQQLRIRKRRTQGRLSNKKLQKRSLNQFPILLEEKGLIGDLYYDPSNLREINEFDQ